LSEFVKNLTFPAAFILLLSPEHHFRIPLSRGETIRKVSACILKRLIMAALIISTASAYADSD